jgi:hypothetical protein
MSDDRPTRKWRAAGQHPTVPDKPRTDTETVSRPGFLSVVSANDHLRFRARARYPLSGAAQGLQSGQWRGSEGGGSEGGGSEGGGPPSERDEFLFGIDRILDGIQAYMDRAEPTS